MKNKINLSSYFSFLMKYSENTVLPDFYLRILPTNQRWAIEQPLIPSGEILIVAGTPIT